MRVEFDEAEPLVPAWAKAERVVKVLYALPDSERTDARDAMFAELHESQRRRVTP